MRKRIRVQCLTICFLFTTFLLHAQEKWDLRKCVEFAWANNISVRQADVQARITELSYKQSLMSRYPNANFSNSTGTNFGRAVDPTTNLFASSTLLFQQYNLNVDALLYNWGRVRNTILSTKYSTEAAFADVERAKNDIGLTVATTYLQVLLAKEQARLAAQQMELTKMRLADTRKRVDAGALPELNALELEAQYARDSSSFIAAVTTADQNLLTLKATLNLDAATPFDITEPPVASIAIENIADLSPEIVYASALKTQPQQKVNDLRIKSLEANLKSAKAGFYPSISAFGGLGSNFSSPNVRINSQFVGFENSSAYVTVAGNDYSLQTPKIELTKNKKGFADMWTGWGNQIDGNFRQNIGVQISVPIFNGGNVRTNYNRVKYDIKNAQLVKEQAEQRLKNDIYQAYLAAVNAMQRFNASKRTLEISEKTFNLAQKRYDAGLLQTIELITNQNNLFRARIQMLSDQFDYVFRMKVLEFYKGLGLRL